MKAQRLRFRYSLAAEARDLGQRDLVTAWEQGCKAAGLPIAYSEGRRPSPQIAIGAPLPQGVTSDCELLDLILVQRVSPPDVLTRLAPRLPAGIVPLAVEEIGANAPSLQSQVRWAEYEVTVRGVELDAVQRSVCRILDARTLPAEYKREKKVRAYDLRPLIIALTASLGADNETIIIMRLRAEPERTARADQVAAELGLPAEMAIHRVRLALEEVPPVLLAYRRLGDRDEE